MFFSSRAFHIVFSIFMAVAIVFGTLTFAAIKLIPKAQALLNRISTDQTAFEERLSRHEMETNKLLVLERLNPPARARLKELSEKIALVAVPNWFNASSRPYFTLYAVNVYSGAFEPLQNLNFLGFEQSDSTSSEISCHNVSILKLEADDANRTNIVSIKKVSSNLIVVPATAELIGCY